VEIVDQVPGVWCVGDAADAEAALGQRLGEPGQPANVARAPGAEYDARRGARPAGGLEQEGAVSLDAGHGALRGLRRPSGGRASLLRDLALQLLVVRGMAGVQVLRDSGGDGLSHPWNILQTTSPVQLVDVLDHGADGPRRLFIGTDAVRIV